MMVEQQLREHLLAQIRKCHELYQGDDLQESFKLAGLVVEAIGFYKRTWMLDFTDLWGQLLVVPFPAYLALTLASEYLYQIGRVDAAVAVMEAVVDQNAPFPVKCQFVRLLRDAGRIEQALQYCELVRSCHPTNQDILPEIDMCHLSDRLLPYDYYTILEAAHRAYQPANYLEIGVAMGRSLGLAGACSHVIGVDPETAEAERQLFLSPENCPVLFKTTSDSFFAQADLNTLLKAGSLDMVFLDGLHLFEQVLRDFMHVEKYASPQTMVFIHDGLPINRLVAERERKTAFWVGDVWKIIPCLKAVRPDLEIITFPAPPSGLTVVRGLDPSSKLLERQFDRIVDHFLAAELPESWEERCALLAVTDQSPDQVLGIKVRR